MKTRTFFPTLASLATAVILLPACKTEIPHCESGLLDTKTNRCLTTDAGSDSSEGDAGSVGAAGGLIGRAGAGGLGGLGGGPSGSAGVGGGGAAGGFGNGGITVRPDAGADAQSTCTTKAQCASTPATPNCNTSTGTCVGCTATSDCSGVTPLCDATTKKCVGCAANADCHTPTPICDAALHSCVACSADADCGGATPACNPTTKTCVACLKNADCTTPGARLCDASSHTCVGCTAATDCAAPTAVCEPTLKICVGCLAASDCKAPTPACNIASKSCVGCLVNSDCPSATPVCDVAVKTCVHCVQDRDCGGVTPICDARACRSCINDNDCVTHFGDPGICMSHLDGHCASNAETMFVVHRAGCSDDTSTAAGTNAMPFCSMALVNIPSFSAGRTVILVQGIVRSETNLGSGASQFTIVGRPTLDQRATITDDYAAIHLISGNAYVRDVMLQAGFGVGLQAEMGTTIRLEHVSVIANDRGGIVLNNAAFDIENTLVMGNGAGNAPNAGGGGITIIGVPASGLNRLNLVTIQNNNSGGIFCSNPIKGTGVLATMNYDVDDIAGCGFTSCGVAGPTCGATP